jgi:hypothetical protein
MMHQGMLSNDLPQVTRAITKNPEIEKVFSGESYPVALWIVAGPPNHLASDQEAWGEWGWPSEK